MKMMPRRISKEEEKLIARQMQAIDAIAAEARPLLDKAGIAYKADVITKMTQDIRRRTLTEEADG